MQSEGKVHRKHTRTIQRDFELLLQKCTLFMTHSNLKANYFVDI